MMAGAARNLVKAAAASADVFRPRPRGLVVLIYHRVGGGTPVQVDVPAALFEEQIAWLVANFEVVPLAEGLQWLETCTAASTEVRIAVTFDDGTADFAENAVPILARHGAPATLYVATEFLEAQTPFPHGGVPLTWSALRDAIATGVVTVGSHTHTHALLDRLPDDRVAHELDRSMELIGERLGIVAEHFAYPKAVPGSPAADAAVRARFASAALAGGHPNAPGRTDNHRLSRTPVQVSDGTTWFRRKARGGLGLEDSIRRLLNRSRYSEMTT
jgi:peptidoglycan/xylan/chitin deacetylase (PgdA/CDA1 family)